MHRIRKRWAGHNSVKISAAVGVEGGPQEKTQADLETLENLVDILCRWCFVLPTRTSGRDEAVHQQCDETHSMVVVFYVADTGKVS